MVGLRLKFLTFLKSFSLKVPYLVCYFLTLSANVGYIRHDIVVTSDSCNSGHSENYEKIFDIFVQELEIFYKMVYKTLYFG